MKLTIISYLRKLDTHFEKIALAVSNIGPDKGSIFSRFQSNPENLRFIISSSPVSSFGSISNISHLDLVGHGTSRNGFNLGDIPIIANNSITDDFRKILNDTLPAETTGKQGTVIRLLGCMTGAEPSGHLLLKSISKELGEREVIGTTSLVMSEDFGIGGLREDFRNLTSSRDHTSSPTVPPSDEASFDKSMDQYKGLLPDGYEFVGVGHPVALVEHELFKKNKDGSTISVKYACENRVIMIVAPLHRAPRIYQWSRGGPAPAPRLNEP
ncbi:hypothetical protein HUW63_07625 [Myxococcus sp. AM001]|nr:hypothetical protein [Myxococcus sp. AM001]